MALNLVSNNVIRWIGTIALIYVLFCAYMYVVQDSIIFYPRSSSFLIPSENQRDFEILVDEVADLRSRGIVVNPDRQGPVVVYFGGNASDTRNLNRYFERLPGPTVLTNYRGYGTSDGEPSEAVIVADAKRITAWTQNQFPHQPLVLMGSSLGAGVAAIAVDDATDGVILVSPYRSLVHVANSNFLYRLLPLRLLMRHQFDATAALERFPSEVLVLYSDPDRLIPTSESREFVAAIPQAQVREYDVGHNSLLADMRVWHEITTWLVENFPVEER